MAKEFKKGINSVLGESTPKEVPTSKAGRPKKHFDNDERPSAERGVLEDETRTTFIVNKELIGIIKAIARTEGVKIKEVINYALATTIIDYSKSNENVLSNAIKDHEKENNKLISGLIHDYEEKIKLIKKKPF